MGREIVFQFVSLLLCAASPDHDAFLRQVHLHELEFQISLMHEKLYSKCPDVFHIPDSAMSQIIGRRQLVERQINLQIELAEATLKDLIETYRNCSSVPRFTTTKNSIEPTNVGTLDTYKTVSVLTKTETLSTTMKTIPIMKTTLTTPTQLTLTTTPYPARHAFKVLRTKNVTDNGYRFLVLEVQLPLDGRSKSVNWCVDYEYLCDDFHMRPSGCGTMYKTQHAYGSCSWYYNSNMTNGDTLGCPPAAGVAAVANVAFPNLTSPANSYNAFGFYRCDIRYASNCRKTLQGSQFSLTYMTAFWESNVTKFYTICI